MRKAIEKVYGKPMVQEYDYEYSYFVSYNLLLAFTYVPESLYYTYTYGTAQ